MKFLLFAVFLGSLNLLAARDAKAVDFCAATLYLKPVGADAAPYRGALYGFTLDAGAPKTVSAILALETETGWFSATVPSVAIAPAARHFIDPGGKHRSVTAWSSPAMFLQFPRPVTLMNAFVLGANGQACPPLQRWALMPKSRGPAPIRDPQYPDATTLAPQTADLVLRPTPTKALFNTNCAEPFHEASVTEQVPPDYPEPVHRGLQGTAQILITLNPGGSLAEAKVFQSSGEINFDRAALRAAVESTYQSATAYCQAVPGSYLFKVTFQ